MGTSRRRRIRRRGRHTFTTAMYIALIAVCFTACLAVDDAAWEAYKTKFGKTYSAEEDGVRYARWKDTVTEVHLHNTQYADTAGYTQGVNQFADMSPQEFKDTMLTLKVPKDRKKGKKFVPSNDPVPNAKDWRQEGYVTDVKNQGQCGSCYSFAATGSLEGQWFKKTGRLPSLSEQQIVDCSGKYGNQGCGGGWYGAAWDYIKDCGGSEGENAYPYRAYRGWCKFKRSKVVAQDTGTVDIEKGSEEELQAALAQVGPVAVAIDASHSSFQRYSEGVYYEPWCKNGESDLDHAVLAVGYGNEDGQDYWLVKNSWGDYWGDEGYIKMIRNEDNNCGIATAAAYPSMA